jgi:FkbM family methyltransferase
MFDKIIKIKKNGYFPDTILDIGAHQGNWTKNTKQIFNNCKYYLFEPIKYKELNELNKNNDIEICNVILNDKKKYINFYQNKNNKIGSIIRDKDHFFKKIDIIKKNSIDLNSYIKENNLFKSSKNILINIGCHGSEIPILKGSSSILYKTDFIILQVPIFGELKDGIPSFLEYIKYMDSIGFIPYDIDNNIKYFYNFNMKTCMIFINKYHNFNIKINNLFI